jgi:hypothetical protein
MSTTSVSKHASQDSLFLPGPHRAAEIRAHQAASATRSSPNIRKSPRSPTWRSCATNMSACHVASLTLATMHTGTKRTRLKFFKLARNVQIGHLRFAVQFGTRSLYDIRLPARAACISMHLAPAPQGLREAADTLARSAHSGQAACRNREEVVPSKPSGMITEYAASSHQEMLIN